MDNIPEQKDHSWLQKTFSKFGEVNEAFIPRKRSKRTGNKFGFVRYERQGDANLAVEKMNGVWIENDRLFVKIACFGQNASNIGAKRLSILDQAIQVKEMRGKQKVVEVREKCFGIRRSYAEKLRGESSKGGKDHKFKLFVKPSGNGWLDRSVVARMNRVVQLSFLQVSFSMTTNRVAQFRSMGGREVLITFQSSAIRDELINEPWMNFWFESVKPWRGEPTSMERLVWLSCKGVPLSVWNTSTFRSIAECWGSLILSRSKL